jgi:hypothetical protein
MYDVDARIVRVEKSRHENICCGLRRKLGEDLSLCCDLLLAIQECCAGRVLVAVGGFVSLQLVVELFFVLSKIILDF